MTLKFRTDSPEKLLKAFKEKMNQDDQEGKIDTWEEHEGGFRHKAKDWKNLGLFKASVSEDKQFLLFSLTKCKGDYTYAYYHGHLLQSFVQHLNSKFQFARYVDSRKKKK